MFTITTDIQELAVMMETFDVSQPSYGERCSDGPCDVPQILQTFSGPDVGLCHFWGCLSCALIMGVSYATNEPQWLDRDGMLTLVESPESEIHLWIPEAGIIACGIDPEGESTESGDGPVTCASCLRADAYPMGL